MPRAARSPSTRIRAVSDGDRALLAELNPAQRRAATTTEGPVLILAGAGSGKTKTLTHRIAYLMTVHAVPPERILAVTFTNKAAREMRERVERLVGKRRGLPVLGTFHSFCARFLRRHGARAGLPPTFTIYDEDEARSVMRSIIADANLSPKLVPPDAVLHRIGAWKDELRTIADAQAMAQGPWEERIAMLWERYEGRLTELAAVDFDGLIYQTVLLLQEDERLRADLEAQFPYLHVDEYQDTNHAQFVLLKLLAGTTNNICAVGDDAQAIYGWRGARVENIRSFSAHFPACTTITLEQNYRSTQAILDSANELIKKSVETFPKKLWTEKEAGAPPLLLRAEDEKDEGRKILRHFQRLFVKGGFRPSDAAILYRTNAQSRALEEACLRLSVPYEIIGGLTFYERKEVRDIIAYLRFLQNPQDELAFRRLANVPARGIGDRTVERCLLEARARGTQPLDAAVLATVLEARREGLATLARVIDDLRGRIAQTDPTELLDELLKRIHFRSWLREESERTLGRPDPGESRYENVLELRTVAERHASLEDFLSELALLSDVEKTTSDRGDRVKLMTIHAAKGLEFPIVAVAGLEEGLLPHVNALETTRELEEERRLCYVALTRAREYLFLSYARVRTMYGKTVETDPSRFLDDLSTVAGDSEGASADGITGTFLDDEPSVDLDAEAPSFLVGDLVRHAHFGAGVVEAVRGTILSVRFQKGVKRLDATQAPLRRSDDALGE